MPKPVFACDTTAVGMGKVTSETASAIDDCKDVCSHDKRNHCGNDCNNGLCKCPTNSNSSFYYSTNFTFKSVKTVIETSFSHYETNISKGFYSIWLIPKIG